MSTPYPRLWLTAERDALVEDGDPRAASLAWSGHEPVPPEVLATVGQPGGSVEVGGDRPETIAPVAEVLLGEAGAEGIDDAGQPVVSSMPEPPADRPEPVVKKAPAPADKRGTRPADKARTRATK